MIFISIDELRNMLRENDQVILLTRRWKIAAHCEFVMHEFSFIDCESDQSECVHISKNGYYILFEFVIVIVKVFCYFFLANSLVFTWCSVHFVIRYAVWSMRCVTEVVGRTNNSGRKKKNVSSRRTLATGYLTKLMDTYEARSIAHVLTLAVALRHCYCHKIQVTVLIIDINNIINLWLGARIAATSFSFNDATDLTMLLKWITW